VSRSLERAAGGARPRPLGVRPRRQKPAQHKHHRRLLLRAGPDAEEMDCRRPFRQHVPGPQARRRMADMRCERRRFAVSPSRIEDRSTMTMGLGFPEKKVIAELTAKMLLEVEAVRFMEDKPFIFTSGWASPVYIDCRRLISFPRVRSTLMDFGAAVVFRDA